MYSGAPHCKHNDT